MKFRCPGCGSKNVQYIEIDGGGRKRYNLSTAEIKIDYDGMILPQTEPDSETLFDSDGPMVHCGDCREGISIWSHGCNEYEVLKEQGWIED